MTGRNPDGIEDFPSPDCPDVAYGPPRELDDLNHG